MKLIIPMAGRGTRVRPHSHVTPKPLLPVRGKSMVERIIDTFSNVLPRRLDEGVFVLGPDFGDAVNEQLTAICQRYDMRPTFVVQETPLGTAHAVAAAHDRLEGEGIVAFADALFDMTPDVTFDDADVIAWTKEVDDPSRFGVVVQEGGRVVRLVEKPSEYVSNQALVGIYYLKDLARLNDAINQILDNDLRGAGGEYQLTDALDLILRGGAVFKTATVHEWLDCGTIDALLDSLRSILAREQTDRRAGNVTNTTVIEPVYIGPGVEVNHSVIGPNVAIEKGARIENAVVRDSIVFARAHVKDIVLTHSIIGTHSTVQGSSTRLNIGDHSTTYL
ncbi:MAG: NTP transferase domain-containing protein [Bacteroidetes bacterium]|nr:NTP transferase domain-containing protein [Bacteroidota bacterium]